MNKATRAVSQFSCHVSCVLQLIDDYTDRAVARNLVTVSIENEKLPLQKEEGFYVFTNLLGREFDIRIRSVQYQEQTLHVNLDAYVKAPVLMVRMVPSMNYVLSENTTCIRGKISSGRIVRAALIEPYYEMKLQEDYIADIKIEKSSNNPENENESEKQIRNNFKSQAHQLSIFNPNRYELPGKQFLIMDKNEQEYFTVIEQKKIGSEEVSIMDRVLTHTYHKTGAGIYRVSQTYADPSGNIYLPIPQVIDQKVKCIITVLSDTKEIIHRTELELVAGKETWLESV